ncbi:MAG: TlpA disulfide reductase family protein [Pseudomonadota bacterium]
MKEGRWLEVQMLRKTMVAVGVFILGSACCPPGVLPSVPQREGPAPEPQLARLFRLDGSETTLAAYQGKVVLLDFWASWCAPCRQAFPYYADLHARHVHDGLAVVAVSIDDERDVATKFARRWGLPFDVLHDGLHEGAAAFSVMQIPATFILDRQGRVRFIHRGFDPVRAGRYEEEVRFLLGESSDT